MIRVGEAPKPVPGEGEVLVRVHAATVNRTDSGELKPPLLGRVFFGLRRPRRTILGLDFAGEVEALGPGAGLFKPGDRVFGMCPARRNGGQAEYVCIPETGAIAAMPAGIGYDEAVVCEGAYYANGGLTGIGLAAGDRILIYGASGAIGTAALQLAKYYGAEVTAAVEARHLDLVRSLGADHAVDCFGPEFRRLGRDYDFVHDAVGKMNVFQWRRLLKPKGVFATTDIGPWGQSLLLLLWSSITGSRRVRVPLPRRGGAHAFVAFMRDRLAAGEYRAVIGRKYPLDSIVDAYRHVMTGQKTGIVVIEIVDGQPRPEAEPA